MKPCNEFETDESVTQSLLHGDEDLCKAVQHCLYHQHAESCIKWLLHVAGHQPPGEADIHNAHHAFNDALMALQRSVKAGRFIPDGQPNAVRRFLNTLSIRTYKKLQMGDNAKLGILLPLKEDEIYPAVEYTYPFESRETLKQIRGIIEKFAPPCNTLLKMRFIDGFSIKEMAQLMGLEAIQLTKQLYKCRQKFKNKLEP
jgi:DNA-directed RNA polymerase specialized sigma24 family protein